MNDKFLDAMIKQSIVMMTEACNGKEGKWDYLYDYYMEQKCDLANKIKSFK